MLCDYKASKRKLKSKQKIPGQLTPMIPVRAKKVKDGPPKKIFMTITYLSRKHKGSNNTVKKTHLLITKLFKDGFGKPGNWL